MHLLSKAMNTTAYAKFGIQGFAGSGKTFTATKIAIGLAKLAGGAPVAFLDTETGSDFVEPMFRDEGIDLFVHKSRAFADSLTVFQEAIDAKCSVIIIDSVSHLWQEMMTSYQKKLRRKYGLQFQDWGALKTEWRQLTDIYVNSPIHALLLGRAGYEYDYETNEDGKKELRKVGTKMKAETEMGYEPSVLLEMERKTNKDQEGPRFINVATILKDRTDTMNGHEIEFPVFGDFAPIIGKLNIGGEHMGVDTSRTSEDLFESPERSAVNRKREVEGMLDEIKVALIKSDCDGTSAAAKTKRVSALEKSFGTAAWSRIQNLRLEDIEVGYQQLLINLGLAERPKSDVDGIEKGEKESAENFTRRVHLEEIKKLFVQYDIRQVRRKRELMKANGSNWDKFASLEIEADEMKETIARVTEVLLAAEVF